MRERSIEYVSGEERCGFYVQPMMKRAWLATLEVLKGIDALCRHRKIRYFAQWGTLLGAVRHQGFIPWDDDLDIAMLRRDYERFQYYARAGLPQGWKVLKIDPTMIRVVNSDVVRLDQEFLDRYHGCPYVMGVDIFAMDSLPDREDEVELFIDLFTAVNNLYQYWDSLEEACEKGIMTEEDKWGSLSEVETVTGHPFDRQSPIKEQLYDLTDQIAAMHWEREYNDVTFITRFLSQREYRIPRGCFDRIIEAPFEHMSIPILEDSDRLLRLRFGDNYMTPARGGARHSYPFFKDQIADLRKYFEEQGMALPEFFDMKTEGA